MAMGLVKNKAWKMVFVYLRKIQSLDFLHRLPTTNWHEIPSVNTVLIKLTQEIFVICRKSFSVVLKVPYVKIQIFHDRSLTWFLNYFLAKFLEFLTAALNWVPRLVVWGFLRFILFENKRCVNQLIRIWLFVFLSKSRAGFYTTQLTARKLCSATLI